MELSSQCMFGDNVLARSTISGRNNTDKLDPEKIQSLKHIVQQRASMNDVEFEGTWVECLESLIKRCQILRKKHFQSSHYF